MISLKKILFEALQDLYRVTSIPALGGVFLLDYKNKILFSEDKSFNTKDLPRFKPQVYISRRKGEQESDRDWLRDRDREIKRRAYENST